MENRPACHQRKNYMEYCTFEKYDPEKAAIVRTNLAQHRTLRHTTV